MGRRQAPHPEADPGKVVDSSPNSSMKWLKLLKLVLDAFMTWAKEYHQDENDRTNTQPDGPYEHDAR